MSENTELKEKYHEFVHSILVLIESGQISPDVLQGMARILEMKNYNQDIHRLFAKEIQRLLSRISLKAYPNEDVRFKLIDKLTALIQQAEGSSAARPSSHQLSFLRAKPERKRTV